MSIILSLFIFYIYIHQVLRGGGKGCGGTPLIILFCIHHYLIALALYHRLDGSEETSRRTYSQRSTLGHNTPEARSVIR